MQQHRRRGAFAKAGGEGQLQVSDVSKVGYAIGEESIHGSSSQTGISKDGSGQDELKTVLFC